MNDAMFHFFEDNAILSMPFRIFGEYNSIFKRKITIVAKRYCCGETESLVRFLNEMLSHWHIERSISIQEILSIFEESIRGKANWWLKKQHDLDQAKARYMCVVALLESINYDCWYTYPLQVCLDEEELQSILTYPLSIDESYYRNI